MKSAFADQSPDGRRLGASGDGCAAVLGLRAFHRRRGERRRIVRGLRAFVHRRGGPQGKRQRRQERAVVEQRMMTRLSARGFFLRRFVRRTLPFLGRRGARFRRRAGKRVRARPRRRTGRLPLAERREARPARLARTSGAAAGAVMACLQFGLAARGSTCVEAHPALARSSARARWACSCRRRAERRRFPY